MVKTLIDLNLYSDIKSYIPVKDTNSIIYCELENKYGFNIEIYGPIYLYILESVNNKYKCWKLYNVKDKSLGSAMKRIRAFLRPNEKKNIFQYKINDLFFNMDHWKWIWDCKGRKVSPYPIYKNFGAEKAYVDVLVFIVELKARLIAKGETIKPEPEAEWIYVDKLTITCDGG
jgi:hypothetical protein